MDPRYNECVAVTPYLKWQWFFEHDTPWQSNRAIENPPFIDALPTGYHFPASSVWREGNNDGTPMIRLLCLLDQTLWLAVIHMPKPAKFEHR